jgi:hypothetical protein
MKTLKIILWLLIPLLATSCLQEGYETIVLNEVNPIDEVVPVEYRLEMEQYMPLYNGETPPNIEGVYLVSPTQLVYSTDPDHTPDSFSNFTIEFSNQSRSKNILEYREIQVTSPASSDEVYIVGTDDNFTAYFTASGTSNGIKVKMATVISGIKSSSGVKNFYYAFVMLEKGKDTDNTLMNEGDFRIFKDGDGNAKNSTWLKSAEINPITGFDKIDNTGRNKYEAITKK